MALRGYKPWSTRWFIRESEATTRVPPNDHDRDSVERRLDSIERALSENEPIDRAERLNEMETRIAELEAAVQALRGYVGSVRAINEEVEHRADRALRKAEAVERNVAPSESHTDDTERADTEQADTRSRFSKLRERL